MQRAPLSNKKQRKSLYDFLPKIEDLEAELEKAEKEYGEQFDSYIQLSLNYLLLSLKATDKFGNLSEIPIQLAANYQHKDFDMTEFKRDIRSFKRKIQFIENEAQRLNYINVVLLHDCTRLIAFLAERSPEFNTPIARKVLKGNVRLVTQKLIEHFNNETKLSCKL